MTEELVHKRIESLLSQIVLDLVEHPESIEIQISVGERTTIFYIKTDQKNLGQIIGSKGRNINSIRTLVASIAGRHNIRAIVELPYYEKKCA